MTKKFKVITLGMSCSHGLGKCGLEDSVILFPGVTNMCTGHHEYESVRPNKLYNVVFDTTRPEQFMGEKNG